MKLGHHDLAVEKYRDAETELTDLADRHLGRRADEPRPAARRTWRHRDRPHDV
jgi:hypothetical protein